MIEIREDLKSSTSVTGGKNEGMEDIGKKEYLERTEKNRMTHTYAPL